MSKCYSKNQSSVYLRYYSQSRADKEVQYAVLTSIMDAHKSRFLVIKLLNPPRLCCQRKHILCSFSCQLLTCLLRYSQITPKSSPFPFDITSPLPLPLSKTHRCLHTAGCLHNFGQRWIAPCWAITRLEQGDRASKLMCIVLNFPPMFYNSAACLHPAGTYWSHILDNIADRSLTWVFLLSTHKLKQHQWNKKSRFKLYSMYDSQGRYTKLIASLRQTARAL